MMNDTIGAARDVTKTITDRVDTFQSPILGALGVFSGDNPVFYRQSLRKHTVDTEFDVSNLTSLPLVEIVYHYSGVTPTMINAAVASGAKGLVHAGVGDGSLAKQEYPPLENALKKGVVIVRSSNVGSGIVARNGEADDDIGAPDNNHTFFEGVFSRRYSCLARLHHPLPRGPAPWRRKRQRH